MHQKGFSPLILIIIITVVLAIGGGSVWYYKQSAEQNKSIPKTAVTPEPAPADETANWKTFYSEKYGFGLKYPQDWSVSSNTAPFYLMFHSAPNSSGVQISISGPNSISDSEYQNLNNGCKKVTLGDTPAYSCAPSGPGAPYYNIYKGGYLITITDFYHQSDLSKKLISTFKFIKQGGQNMPSQPSLSKCVPVGIKLSDVVDAKLMSYSSQTNVYDVQKTTVEQKLNDLKATCNSDGKLVDANGKQISFYRLAGCWGNPPYNYLDILQKQQDDINKLKEQYTVIEMTCNPSGIPVP